MAHAYFSQAICDLWIDEVKGIRCNRNLGHDGPCKHEKGR